MHAQGCYSEAIVITLSL